MLKTRFYRKIKKVYKRSFQLCRIVILTWHRLLTQCKKSAWWKFMLSTLSSFYDVIGIEIPTVVEVDCEFLTCKYCTFLHTFYKHYVFGRKLFSTLWAIVTWEELCYCECYVFSSSLSCNHILKTYLAYFINHFRLSLFLIIIIIITSL